MNIFKKAEKIIVFVENPHIPFLNYFLLFLSSVTLRTFLEIFSDRAVVYFRFFPSDRLIYLSVWQSLAISFMHYYVFWVTLILTLGIIFYFITREDVGKILRTLLAFSFVLNITPLFDLIITAGRGGLDIAYVYPKNILNLLPIPKSLTPGMALTSITGFILSFIYCRVKTNSLKKGLLGALGIYILLVVTSLIPFLLKVRHPVPIIRAQLIIVFIELVLIFFWLKKQYFLALIKDVRYYRMLHFVSMFILGVILSGEPVTKVLLLNLDVFLLTFIAVSLSWIASVIFNNIEDLEIDKISNMNRPLVTHKIPQNDYRRIGIGAACLSGIFALGVNFQTLFFAYLLMGNALLVSLPPLRFKRIPIFSKLFISLSSLIVVMLGYIFAGKEFLDFPYIITWYFLVFVTLVINFIDLKDYEGDKKAGIKTLPVICGLKKAKLIIGGFFLISYAILNWVLLDTNLLVPGLIFGGLHFYYINKRQYQEKLVFLTYLLSLLLLFIYLTI